MAKKIITSVELKNFLSKELIAIGNSFSKKDMMLIAVDLDIALATVQRYLSGEVRNLELAEKILEKAKNLSKNIVG